MDSIIDLFVSIVNLFFSVFAFLPSWVQSFVGGTVVFVILVILYKLIRGS